MPKMLKKNPRTRFLVFFAPHGAAASGRNPKGAATFGLECLVSIFTSGKPSSPLAHRVKEAVLEHRLASVAAAYLVKRLPANMDAGSQQWGTSRTWERGGR